MMETMETAHEKFNQDTEPGDERSVMMESVSEEIEMIEMIEMPPLHGEEGGQEIERGNKRTVGNEHYEEKRIEYLEILETKSFFETLQFHKKHFPQIPLREEMVNPITKEKGTTTEAFIALALFIMR